MDMLSTRNAMDDLQQKLSAIAATKKLQNVAVSYYSDGLITSAFTNSRTTSTEDRRGKIGCIAKSMTATLFAYWIDEYHFAFEDHLAKVLSSIDIPPKYKKKLEPIRLSNLL